MTSVSMTASRSVRMQRRTGEGPSIVLILGVFVFALGLGVGFAWSRTELVHTAMRAGELRREERELEKRERELASEVSSLKNAARIERVARQKLGLVTRSPAQVLQIRPEILQKAFARNEASRDGGGEP